MSKQDNLSNGVNLECSVPPGNESLIYLKDDALYFFSEPLHRPRTIVPPPPPTPTPTQKIDFTREKQIPEIRVDEIKQIPTVKEGGIKFTIENLGHQLGLPNYEYDLIQFWLLDILSDCVWKAQEIFHFEEQEQKLILNWIMALFKIIADPILNITRKGFLKMFKEILLELYRKISKECDFPQTSLLEEYIKRYFLKDDEDKQGSQRDEESETASNSSHISLSTFSIRSVDPIIISPEFNIREHIYRLKNNNPLEYSYHCYSERNSVSNKAEETLEEESYSVPYYGIPPENFYKADNEYPSRFINGLPIEDICEPPYICTCLDSEETVSQESELKVNEESISTIEEEYESTTRTKSNSNELQDNLNSYITNITASSQILDYLTNEKHDQIFPMPCMKATKPVDVSQISEVLEEPLLSEDDLEYIAEKEIINEWKYFLMMEQRGWDMDDPKVGWIPWLSFMDGNNDELENFIATETELSSQSGQNECNSCRSRNFMMLKAVVNFVFEYFYQNFHFTLIKLAFRSTPFSITQEINSKWPIPKVIKQEFKRPKPPKKAKEKTTKLPKVKPMSKFEKKSPRDSKDKKDKKKKKEKEKNVQKVIKPKPDKEELDRLKMLAELEEAERIKREENRVLMFPLADAASEHLFMTIFENWVKQATNTNTKKEEKGEMKKKRKR